VTTALARLADVAPVPLPWPLKLLDEHLKNLALRSSRLSENHFARAGNMVSEPVSPSREGAKGAAA
jgi:hypothetical protein